MHEVGIMQSALKTAFNMAENGEASEITKIVLQVGSLSSVVPESLQSAFDSLVPHTMAANAILEIDWIEAQCHCTSCDSDFLFRDHGYICPSCSRPVLALLCGKELNIKTIEWR